MFILSSQIWKIHRKSIAFDLSTWGFACERGENREDHHLSPWKENLSPKGWWTKAKMGRWEPVVPPTKSWSDLDWAGWHMAFMMSNPFFFTVQPFQAFQAFQAINFRHFRTLVLSGPLGGPRQRWRDSGGRHRETRLVVLEGVMKTKY